MKLEPIDIFEDGDGLRISQTYTETQEIYVSFDEAELVGKEILRLVKERRRKSITFIDQST